MLKSRYPRIVLSQGRYYLQTAEAVSIEILPPTFPIFIAQLLEELDPGAAAALLVALMKLDGCQRDAKIESQIHELLRTSLGEPSEPA